MTAPAARHEILVALHAHDEDAYATYRERMTPILHAMGGHFRRDYRVAQSLAEGDPSTNRVFIISFPDRQTADRFFADPAYKQIRADCFDPAVTTAEILAAYDTPNTEK